MQWALLAVLPAFGESPPLVARVRVREDGLALMELENVSARSLNVLVSHISVDGLELLFDPETRSRAGKRRVWQPLPPGQKLELGPYKVVGAVSDVRVETEKGVLHLAP